MSAPAEKEYIGGCHCQKFRYKFTHEPFDHGEREVETCSCSICVHKGAVWAYVCCCWVRLYADHTRRQVPESKFALTKGTLGELTLSQFHKKTFEHYFFPVCGVQFMLNVPEEMAVHINVRTTDGVDVEGLKTKLFDGKNLL